MILTEADAKKKWCPFVRARWSTTFVDAPAVSRTEPGSPLILNNCIGAACMTWRWHDHDYGECNDPGAVRKGFCGLAGNPAAP